MITSALIIHTKWDLIGQMSVTMCDLPSLGKGKRETVIYRLLIYPRMSKVWFSESLIRIKGYRNQKIWLTVIDKFESSLSSVYHSNRNEHPVVS